MLKPKDFEFEIKKYFINSSSEPIISGILGLFVVILIGNFAFNYFNKYQRIAKITDEAASTVNTQIQSNTRFNSPVSNYYLVKPGDDLSIISNNFYGKEDYWTYIAEVNNISSPDLLFVGQKLVIPTLDIQKLDQEKDSTINFEYQGDTYQVQIGDTLRTISFKIYGDENLWTVIASANNILDPDNINIDQVLTIPKQ